MPKIGKITLTYKDRGKEFDMYYSRKEGFYIKDFPQDVEALTEFKNNAATEGDLVSRANEACRRYRELSKTKRYVIAVYCIASTELTMNLTGQPGSYSGIKKGVSDKLHARFNSNLNDLAIQIGFDAYMEINDGVQSKYYQIDSIETMEHSKYSKSSIGGNKISIMEFTPERWKFFEGIKDAMQNMVYQLSKFFGGDNETIAAIVDKSMAAGLLPFQSSQQPDS